MRKARVYQTPSGHLRVVNPNWNRKPAELTDEQYSTFACDKAEQGDPTLQGLPKIDLPLTDFPEKTRLLGGKPYSVRNEWRLVAGRVQIDQAAVVASPHFTLARAIQDLDAELAKPVPDVISIVRLQRQIEIEREKSGQTFDKRA